MPQTQTKRPNIQGRKTKSSIWKVMVVSFVCCCMLLPAFYAMAADIDPLTFSAFSEGDLSSEQNYGLSLTYQKNFCSTQILEYSESDAQNNLGLACANRKSGDRGANLNEAIACYKKALRFSNADLAPMACARILNNLGDAYFNLPIGDHDANLNQAIMYYHKAQNLTEGAPLDYARIQISLGNVYCSFIAGDRGENIKKAIACYQDALQVLTPAASPLDYAGIQTNLGIIYSNLATGDHDENLKLAIESYNKALLIPNLASLDYASIQTNLGNVYCNLLSGESDENIKKAIACYKEALPKLKPETSPLEYAGIQTNLGNAYGNLMAGDRNENLKMAITCYEDVLSILTPATEPLEYARVQANLGNVYSKLSAGDRRANVSQAFQCYKNAARYLTLEKAPYDCLQLKRNLANLYFVQKDWKSALAAYRAAIEMNELLYQAGFTDESKNITVAQNANLYRNAAYAIARNGHVAEALIVLERGKTRLLNEALRLHSYRPDGLPGKIWTDYEQACKAMHAAQIDNSMLPTDPDPHKRQTVQACESREKALREAKNKLDEAVDQIRQYDPDFQKEINLHSIQDLIPDAQTALVSFCITDLGSMGFVLTRNQVKNIQMVDVPQFTSSTLRKLIEGSDQAVDPGWIGAYLNRRNQNGMWKSSMTQVLEEVGEKLLQPILKTLPADIKKIVFLPSGELFILPLHAAPISLPHKPGPLVCDDYLVSYAPSATVLAECRARALQRRGEDIFLVINPQEDPQLGFAQFEGKVIAKLFARNQRKICKGRVAKKNEVMDGMGGKAYLHFTCHGTYSWNAPLTSGLVLADGLLTLKDLQSGAVDMSATKLVTLSACETGISDVIRDSADEYIGLPAGFIMAGVPCIVSSLWAVPDLPTSLLMERFYRNHMKGGMNAADALQEAQTYVRQMKFKDIMEYCKQYPQPVALGTNEKALLNNEEHYYTEMAAGNSEDKPFEHPYYWAAFTINGFGGTGNAVEKSRSLTPSSDAVAMAMPSLKAGAYAQPWSSNEAFTSLNGDLISRLLASQGDPEAMAGMELNLPGKEMFDFGQFKNRIHTETKYIYKYLYINPKLTRAAKIADSEKEAMRSTRARQLSDEVVFTDSSRYGNGKHSPRPGYSSTEIFTQNGLYSSSHQPSSRNTAAPYNSASSMYSPGNMASSSHVYSASSVSSPRTYSANNVDFASMMYSPSKTNASNSMNQASSIYSPNNIIGSPMQPSNSNGSLRTPNNSWSSSAIYSSNYLSSRGYTGGPMGGYTGRPMGGYTGGTMGGYTGGTMGGYTGGTMGGYTGGPMGGYTGGPMGGYTGRPMGGYTGGPMGGYTGGPMGGYTGGPMGGYTGGPMGGYTGGPMGGGYTGGHVGGGYTGGPVGGGYTGGPVGGGHTGFGH